MNSSLASPTPLFGTGDGTQKIQNGQNITIDCSEGVGRIYDGMLKYHVDELKIDNLPETKTKIMMNVGVPEKAFTQGIPSSREIIAA